MARTVWLATLVFTFSAGLAAAGEMELLPLREGAAHAWKPGINQFTPPASGGTHFQPVFTPNKTASEIRIQTPFASSAVLPAHPAFLSWKNVCAGPVEFDADVRIPGVCQAGFLTLEPYVGKDKNEVGGMFGYFLPRIW